MNGGESTADAVPRSYSKAIPKASLRRSSTDFERMLEEAQEQLRAVSSTLRGPRRSSKRKSTQEYSIDINETDMDQSVSVSRKTSPVAQRPRMSNGYGGSGSGIGSSISQPRIVLTSSSPPPEEAVNGSFDGPSSPTPSNAPSVASTTTQVTLQMLRALSRDVLNTYGPKEKRQRGRQSM